jgi:uncharacterized membrane protein YbaN (DUF454 family)
MRHSDAKKPSASLTFNKIIVKAVLVLIIGLCLVLGVIGLILPVIPGILFLFIGAILLSKLSTRFASYLKQNTWAQKWQRRGDSFRKLNNGHRLKLSFLMAAKSVVDSMESVWQKLQRTTAK